MKKIEPKTLKGFRDFLPLEARKRQYVINTLKSVFELYGFEPLETPVLEYEEILTGKYGDEGDKLMYRFEDNGKRRVAMRYDQTVPLARVVAQYQNQLAFPFKRYQIQPVWRADKPQKGRYREFIQCDIDTVGTDSLLAEAEMIAIVDQVLKKLKFPKYEIRINNRNLLFNKLKEAGINEEMFSDVIRNIDKVDKIGWQQLDKNLEELGIPTENVKRLNSILSVSQSIEQIPYLSDLENICKEMNITNIVPKLYLARGLDYYTGLIIEIIIPEYGEDKSVGGGGRYDNLIGMFAGKDIPAVGFAFGFDRLLEAMEALNLFPEEIMNASTQVLVTIFSEDLKEKSLEMASKLRSSGINTEIYLGEIKEKNALEKQLKYANAKNIPFVLIAGPQEIEKNIVVLRDMKTREQTQGTIEELMKNLHSLK